MSGAPVDIFTTDIFNMAPGAIELLLSLGASVVDAAQRANGFIAQTILKQATLLSYIDAFWTLTVVCVLAIPLILRAIPLGQGEANRRLIHVRPTATRRRSDWCDTV